MTQSGQGEEPSARPAREGIVLPSDGGEPLLPGMTGGSQAPHSHADGYGGYDRGGYDAGGYGAGPQPGPYDGSHDPSYGSPQPGHGAGPQPATGQTWGGPWGPDQQPPAWPPPADQQWGPSQQGGPGPLPPENTPQPSYGSGVADGQGGPQASYGHGAAEGQGGPQASYGHGVVEGQGGPEASYGHGAAEGQGGPQASYGNGATDGQSAPEASYGHGVVEGQGGAQASYGPGVAGGASVPLPPAADDGATQYIPPVSAGAGAGAGVGAGAGMDGATQYIPPVSGQSPGPGPVDNATQFIRPVAGRGDEGATQYLPPVASGALPPESRAESTTYLGRDAHSQGPGGSDADATQYIPPVTGQTAGRQTPAEFENLFRSGPGGGEPPAASTQQMPRFSAPENPGYGGPSQPSFIPPAARRAVHDDVDDHGGRRGGGRTGSRVPLFAAIGVAIAVVGIGAGAMMAGGGGGDDKGDDKTVAASLPAEESPSPSATVDEAEQQATALDKLLADSGNSRASVIKAVADVKACTNLKQAATDLRAAAQQRTDLVTRLNGLSVDKLPDHAALTTALTKAWQASASADNHYAAWADQVAARKGDLCKKGKAKGTAETQAGNRASGTATTQKKTAAPLWNSIATTYGLTPRQPVQL